MFAGSRHRADVFGLFQERESTAAVRSQVGLVLGVCSDVARSRTSERYTTQHRKTQAKSKFYIVEFRGLENRLVLSASIWPALFASLSVK